MQSLLTAVLVILILLLVVVIFIPAYLERRSRANRQRRAAHEADLAALARDARRLERALAPFRRQRAAAYRAGAAAAGEQLAALDARLDATARLIESTRCPQVHGYLLPAQHFMLAPQDAAAIAADTRRLARARAELAAAAAAAAETQAAIRELERLPGRLADDRAALARRLAEIDAAIQGEHALGIAALEDLAREANRARGLLAEWDRVDPARGASAALGALDEGALALEAAAAGITELEARTADAVRERMELDERLARAAAELDEAQAATKSGPGSADAPAQVRPLLRRAAALLNESAPAHRRRREYSAAAADVAAATRLVAVARDLAAADRQARRMAALDDGAILGDALGALRRELAELLDGLDGERPEAARGGLADSALAARAARVRARAETLARQQDEAIAALEGEAALALDRVERAWSAAQGLLPLAADDALSRRHARLRDQHAAAGRRPSALESFRNDAAAFEGVLVPWVTRVQAARARVARLRARLPQLVDAALAEAGSWRCLAESVTFIQQRAADFETVQAHFQAARYRREAEGLMDQLEAIEAEVEDRYAQLSDRAERLRFLENDVGQIVELGAADVAAFPADHPARVRWDKAMKLIDHHTRTAHAATSYEDASVALLRAADVANKLAL